MLLRAPIRPWTPPRLDSSYAACCKTWLLLQPQSMETKAEVGEGLVGHISPCDLGNIPTPSGTRFKSPDWTSELIYPFFQCFTPGRPGVYENINQVDPSSLKLGAAETHLLHERTPSPSCNKKSSMKRKLSDNGKGTSTKPPSDQSYPASKSLLVDLIARSFPSVQERG